MLVITIRIPAFAGMTVKRVMEVVTALIGVSDITTRNKPHKDPEAILNQVQHMVQDAPVQQPKSI